MTDSPRATAAADALERARLGHRLEEQDEDRERDRRVLGGQA